MSHVTTNSDVPVVLRMCRSFHSDSDDSDVPFDNVGMEGFLYDSVRMEDRCLFHHDHGFIAGVMGTLPYLSTEFKIAYEVLWFAELGGRELFDDFLGWAEDQGARRVIVSHRCGDRDIAISRVYRSRGFVPHERYYRRDV